MEQEEVLQPDLHPSTNARGVLHLPRNLGLHPSPCNDRDDDPRRGGDDNGDGT